MKKIIYIDFANTLFRLTPQGWKVQPQTAEYLASLGLDYRLGLLCNIPAGHTEETMRLLLRAHGLEAWFEPGLVFVIGAAPFRLPRPAAFRMAAALAAAQPGELRFISGDAAALTAAKDLGWTVEPPQEGLASQAGLLADGGAAGVEAVTPGPIYPDRSPTYVLKGRVVTMDAASRVIDDGRILVRNGKITQILGPADALPPEFATAPVVSTKSTLYPGLIDLHNHLAYNILPPWNVPGRFTNRAQWQKAKEYPAKISLPARVIAGHDPTAKAAARYIEAKAIVGGCTTSQGVMMIEKKIVKYFKGLMRNVENTGDPRLPRAATSVLDLKIGDTKSTTGFRRNLENNKAFFYHLSEGTDVAARQRFQDLVDGDLLGTALIGIHSLALNKDDLKKLKEAGGKIVWSPFSNLLLYGETLTLQNVLDSGISVALGCDWAPSGSKNPLLELKVAQWRIHQSGAKISPEQLVRMVTSTPAVFLGWEQYLGSLKAGAMADLVAIAGETGDPYAKLIAAREKDINLVTIHGTPRYGDNALLRAILPASEVPEILPIDGLDRAFYFQHPESSINDVTLAAATDSLLTAMADLPAFVQQTGQVKAGLLAAGLDPADEFGLVLDMDGHDGADESGLEAATLLAQVDPAKIAKSVDLDPLFVNTPFFWNIVNNEKNLPAGLAAYLAAAYA